MEGSNHSLVPKWLKRSENDSRVAGTNNQSTSSPHSDHITYSGQQGSSSSKGAGLSRSYSSSERNSQDRDQEKDIDSDGQTSASRDISLTVGNSSKAMMMHHYNVSTSTSYITPGTMGLTMAETLAQGPSRPYSPPQLSASAQKLEELALKQSRLLIPVTPSTPRSLSRRLSHSGSSLNVSTSRELNGVSSAAKDNLSPSSRVVLSPVGATISTSVSAPSRSLGNNSTPTAWLTLEKKPTFPIQSRNDFFKNLSRKSSLEKTSDILPIDLSCALEKPETSTRNVTSPILKSRDAISVDTSARNILTDYGPIITENGNAANGPLKPSSSGKKKHSSNSFPYPDEEEIAFLHSLGWEESAEDDEGLTEEEIKDFYEKYMKLKQ